MQKNSERSSTFRYIVGNYCTILSIVINDGALKRATIDGRYLDIDMDEYMPFCHRGILNTVSSCNK